MSQAIDSNVDHPVHRLVPPLRNREVDLARRGVSPDAIQDVISNLDKVVLAASLNDVIARSFRPREGQSPPYSIGRFGDGTFPVFYSALEGETAVEEIRYHVGKRIREDGQARRLQMIKCRFRGSITSLLGLETAHSELVSQDESGYPYCQKVARDVRGRGVFGLHTPSARREAGVCVPVFIEEAISEPAPEEQFVFRLLDQIVIAEPAGVTPE